MSYTPTLTLVARKAPRSGGLLWDVLFVSVYPSVPPKLIATATRNPLFDGARELIAMGYSEEVLVTLRHEGSDHDSFKPMKLGTAAKLTTSEEVHRSVRFRTDAAARAGEWGMAAVERHKPFPDVQTPETPAARVRADGTTSPATSWATLDEADNKREEARTA